MKKRLISIALLLTVPIVLVLVLILISPYQINHLTGNIPSPAGVYNCGRQAVGEILKIESLNLCQIKFFIAGEYPP